MRSPEDVDLGLTYLAMAAGNVRAAERRMAADGHNPVPASTLHQWKHTTHHHRYQEILTEKEHQRREETAERLDDLVQQEIDAAQETLERYRKELKDIPARDLAGSLRNLKVGLGIGNQNAHLLRDRPTEITEKRIDIPALDATLRRLGIVEGTAAETREHLELTE